MRLYISFLRSEKKCVRVCEKGEEKKIIINKYVLSFFFKLILEATFYKQLDVSFID